METTHRRLRAWRLARGISQARAAEAAAMSQPQWSRVEAGMSAPSIAQAIAITSLTEGLVRLVDWA